MVKDNSIEQILVKCINTLNKESDSNDAINELLSVIGEFYHSDRAYIYEFHKDMVYMSNTYEWCDGAVERDQDAMTNVPIRMISGWFKLFREQGEVVIRSIEEVTEGSLLHNAMVRENTDSILVAPIYEEKNLVGFIGVDNPRDNEDTLLILHSAGALIRNHMERRVTIEQKALKTLGGAYVSLHIINLNENTLEEFNSTENIRRYSAVEGDNVVKMRSVMQHLTDPEYRENVLRFTDLTTINDRMSLADHLSMEFVSNKNEWNRCHFFAVDRLSDGTLNNFIFAVELIDDEKRKQLEYQMALKKAWEDKDTIYDELLRVQSGGVVATDAENKTILVANAAALQMFGFASKDEIGGEFAHLRNRIIMANGRVFDEGEQDAFESELYDSLRYGRQVVVEYAVDAGSEIVYILSKIKQITLAGGQKINVRSLTDITEKKHAEEQLQKQSRTDSLTGLYNREYGEKCIKEALSKGENGMFCLMDVDRFKAINDTYGREAGDAVLMAIADVILANLADTDIGMRLGADEFAVFVGGLDSREECEQLLGRFFMDLEKIRIPEMGERGISVSLGALLCNDTQNRSYEKIYRKADVAMYHCKKNRGNQYSFVKQ